MEPRRLTGAARIQRVPFSERINRWLLHGPRLLQPAMSQQGVAELAWHEAIVLSPYYDSVRVLTIDIGHTRAAGAPDPASCWGMIGTIPQALQVLGSDIANRYGPSVDRAFIRPLTQAQKDAAVSFNYNTGAIGTASWVKLWNAGDGIGARQAFMAWDQPASIVPRRTAECRLFFDGVYSSDGTATLIPANGAGTLLWGQAKQVDLGQWLGRRAV